LKLPQPQVDKPQQLHLCAGLVAVAVVSEGDGMAGGGGGGGSEENNIYKFKWLTQFLLYLLFLPKLNKHFNLIHNSQ
jgi:hypothetical protein